MRILRGRSGRGNPGGNRENEEQQTRYLSVESAAEMIDSLPSDVPRESQLRIVREAFGAAGIDVSNLERHTRTRGAQLGSEIELVRNRQKELREKTEESRSEGREACARFLRLSRDGRRPREDLRRGEPQYAGAPDAR